MIEGTDSVDDNDDNSDKNTLIMKTRVMKIGRMRIMMITSSMVKAVILNTLAISREVVGEARSNPTCRSPPSPPATSLGAIVEENLKNTRNRT